MSWAGLASERTLVVRGVMAGLLPPPTPTRDYSRDEDSDSDVSEDSAGRNSVLFTQITYRISHIVVTHRTPSQLAHDHTDQPTNLQKHQRAVAHCTAPVFV